MRISKVQDPFVSLIDLLTNRNWVQKNRYLHFRHPKVQVKKNLSHFWLSVAAISQQLPSVQSPLCFQRIKQQKTSLETSHFLYRFSLIFTSFPNLWQLKSSSTPKQVHQAHQRSAGPSSQRCSGTVTVPSTACPTVPLSAPAGSYLGQGYFSLEVPGRNSSLR